MRGARRVHLTKGRRILDPGMTTTTGGFERIRALKTRGLSRFAIVMAGLAKPNVAIQSLDSARDREPVETAA
jgi:hypothetical protein